MAVDTVDLAAFAMLQGIASLANTDTVDRSSRDGLTTYAVDSLLGGLTPRQASHSVREGAPLDARDGSIATLDNW